MIRSILYIRGCFGVVFFLCLATPLSAAPRAKNVVLFLADGGGLPTVNAASILGYGKPRALYIQNMPYIGLAETSSASSWVSDSAASMTAIMTGEKTHNGVISQSAEAERGVKDGRVLKTLLEYAEERGLSTGVISNSSLADATPAACYAHANDRNKHGEIFLQVLKPRFGNGIDVMIGLGRKSVLEKTAALGVNLSVELPKKGLSLVDSLTAVANLPGRTQRFVALSDEEFEIPRAVELALQILSRNSKGFFLMVESNTHSESPKQDLDRMVAFDRAVRQTAERLRRDTLILVTADHSHDLRLTKGKKGEDILPLIRVSGGTHTAEEVLVSAEGPGAERVKGILPNTELFHIMMGAFGWK
ncbi:MAG: alkaline phosphatase [Acidobacteriota bacterium]